jgi:polyisoprenoid-binding protein YceI
MVVTTLALGLEGCPTRPNAPYPPPVQRRVPGQTPAQALGQPHEGRPYDIVSDESLLTLLVFRGGPLAKAGHNHVIASHTLRGTLYVPSDLTRATFDVHFPVAELTVDEAALRAKENEADFPPDVPDSAKEGTRKNMLGAALLDAERHPDIDLQSSGLEQSGSQWMAHVKVTVRDHDSTIAVPVRYEPQGDELIVSGEFPLKQTDLGLTPFSALLGALQVVDEMKVRFRIAAHAAATAPK